MQKVVIIGAGPAGLLMAHSLLERGGYQIEIYERRPDPRLDDHDNQRTYPLTLQSRGLSALRTNPELATAVAAHGSWSQGSLMHRKRGKPRLIERKSPLLLIDRNQLTQVMLEQLVVHPGGEHLVLQFNCPCTRVNADAGTVTVQPENGEACTISFDRLVVADGARSQVRESLQAQGALTCTQKVVPDAYKSLSVPKQTVDDTPALAANRIHTWTLGRGMRVLMAPLPGDVLGGVIIFPPDNNPFDALPTGRAVQDFLQANCPALGPLVTVDAAETLRQAPVARIVTVRCDRMHVGDRILLIGDAIHAVSPALGQGCNASLQDVQVFRWLLDQHQDDWQQALPAFTSQRLPDVHALRDLSDYCFPRSKPMMLEFVFRLTIGKKLGHWLPQLAKPLPMQLVMEGERPYSEVLAETQGWIDRVRRSR